MIVQITKDYKHYEILYESEQEAQAVADYQNQLLVRGFVEGTKWVTKQANWQHEQETSTE